MENKELRKVRIGRVTSTSMDKTITVTLESKIKHPLYGKFISRTKKYAAHDERNECQVGDLVKIIECRPLSKRKRWRMLEIVEKVK